MFLLFRHGETSPSIALTHIPLHFAAMARLGRSVSDTYKMFAILYMKWILFAEGTYSRKFAISLFYTYSFQLLD